MALAAIKQALQTGGSEDSVSLYVEHHLAELPADYWIQQVGTDAPEPGAVIDLLSLRSSWGENDIEYYDFTLPAEVTQYVISVHFDSEGIIDGISMES